MDYLWVPGPNALFASSCFACLIYDESRYVHLSLHYHGTEQSFNHSTLLRFCGNIFKGFSFLLSFDYGI